MRCRPVGVDPIATNAPIFPRTLHALVLGFGCRGVAAMLRPVSATEIRASIQRSYWLRLGPALRRGGSAMLLVVVVAAILLARFGTTMTRALAIGLIVLGTSAMAQLIRKVRNSANGSDGSLVRTVGKLDPKLAGRIARSAALLQRTRASIDKTSVDLAELHELRLWQKVPAREIEQRANTLAQTATLVGWVALLVSVLVCVLIPYHLVEGGNVLLARQSRAPLAMYWVETEPVTAQSPAYLREPSRLFEFDSSASVAVGTTLSVRGTARFVGRRLVLTDGLTEVPFVSDARGGISARYTVTHATRLSIAARFGQVRVFQEPGLEVTAIADEPPEVTLEDAGKRIDVAKTTEVELHYRVRDDHGISLILLELSSGTQKEQRPLTKFEYGIRRHEGSWVLRADDPFISQCVGAVEVRLVARDACEIDGPNNGYSDSLWLDKPAIGATAAERNASILGLRSAFVDLYDLIQSGTAKSAIGAHYREQVLPSAEQVMSLPTMGGRTGRNIKSFVRAQLDKLTETRLASANAAPLVIEATLSIDAILEALGRRDAEQVARQLALVASEIEQNAREAVGEPRRVTSIKQVGESNERLKRGAEKLAVLGMLGADLGQIALAGTVRIQRLTSRSDFAAVARAASFLAERLNRPTPSFVGGGRPSVESGAGRSSGSHGAKSSGPASEAATRFDRLVNELRQLADDHVQAIGAVKDQVETLERAMDEGEASDEHLRHAEALRRIVQGLPHVGGEPGSARASASLAKELTYGAAESLGRQKISTALQSLRQAEGALQEAEQQSALVPSDGVDPTTIKRVRSELAEQRRWLESQIGQRLERESKKAREAFRDLGKREAELAERARAIANREEKEDSVLPEAVQSDLAEAARYMLEASRELSAPHGKAALERQKKAQELLERSDLAREEPKSEDGRDSGRRSGRSKGDPRGEGPVVSTSDPEARERFRQRVLKGLEGEYSPESEARIRRYVEGLLR